MKCRGAVGALAMLVGCLGAADPARGQAAGVSSENVEHVRNIPRHADSSGARKLGNFFYITTGRDLTIYDVSQPENPVEVGDLVLPLPEQPALPEEDVDTNGRILLVENQSNLFVIDVTNKASPAVIGRVTTGAAVHTITCVLDCTYAYGNNGKIFDLRDPTNPALTTGDWRRAAPVESTHDVTEVSPGIVMTASQPMHLIDARVSPVNPTRLRSAPREPGRFVHATRWPRGTQDRFMLVGGEEIGPGCSGGESATFSTWDAATFREIDEYRIVPDASGTTAPDSTYCTHWFQEHPNYRNGGLMAISWYEHGTRFLRIGSDGKINEEGFFLPTGAPVAGQASAAYWISDRVVYVADYLRGLDVLRFTGDISGGGPADQGSGSTGPGQPTGGAPGGAANPSPRDDINRYLKLASISRCIGRKGLLPLSLRSRPPERVSALAVYANGRRAGLRRAGGRLRRRNLFRLPKRAVLSVRVAIRTRSGRRLATRLSYRRCSARRAQVIPAGTAGSLAGPASTYGRLCYIRGRQGAN